MEITLESCEITDATMVRRALGTFATGVTVVTVGGSEPHGMTANSFTAVSLDPPLVLVCVEHEALMHQSLQLVGQFGVSVLAAGQEAIARYFADRDRPLGEAQFDNVDWHPGAQTSAPLITGALAHFECQLWHAYNGGDHTIFVGSLLALDRCPDEEALLFLGGKFGRLDSDQNEVSR